MNFSALDPMLRPKSVAVIGASDDATRIGGRPIAYMLQQGFAGAIWPVNPKRDTVQGLPAYASPAALPGAPDVAIIAVPGDAAREAIDALGEKGCRAAIVFTAGFAEVGEEGAAAQDVLVAALIGDGDGVDPFWLDVAIETRRHDAQRKAVLDAERLELIG